MGFSRPSFCTHLSKRRKEERRGDAVMKCIHTCMHHESVSSFQRVPFRTFGFVTVESKRRNKSPARCFSSIYFGMMKNAA